MKFPRISIITPSYNQGGFLERTIKSVLDQGYPNLEYIIIDGGSTDESVDIIRKYETELHYWISENDRGQAHAINKGLRVATGEWVGWQNSDDVYYEGAFELLARNASTRPEADLIIGNAALIDAEDRILRELHYVRPTYLGLLSEGMVLTNQSAFWKRRVHDEIGYLDENLQYSFDYEWFLRVTRGRKTAHINRVLGAFRLHESSKTATFQLEFLKENKRILPARRIFRYLKPVFLFRRAFLLLLQGDFKYVLGGLWERRLKRPGHLY